MEKEFTKTKIVLATVVGIAFLSMITTFIVLLIQKPVGSKRMNVQQNVPVNQDVQKTEEAEEIVPDDQIDFSDPGNDDTGKDVKAMDELINDALPSEYDEEGLSESVIEGTAELQ